jgi:7-keto-8-aminopelargonate synthetase-like enzyme
MRRIHRRRSRADRVFALSGAGLHFQRGPFPTRYRSGHRRARRSGKRAEPHELRQRTDRFRQIAAEWGIPLGGSADAPVASLVIGNGDLCMLLSQRLLEQGIHVQPIVYPAVSQDGARLRFFITVDHTEAQFRVTMPVIAKELEAIGQLAG